MSKMKIIYVSQDMSINRVIAYGQQEWDYIPSGTGIFSLHHHTRPPLQPIQAPSHVFSGKMWGFSSKE
jgi:hypothetical protein